ncbi:MAG TPA: hypothetical protein VLU46_04625 [Thermoanaerobaculia bacterium]|nr:hypothetical protein [Thermoanaerobaculia bacterium]
MSGHLSVATLACVLVFACAKSDPSDPAFIAKDLRDRSAQEIHDAADKFTFDVPEGQRLTERQLADYVRVVKLAERIRAAVAVRGSNPGEVIASARSYATAELRACLNLGLNPKEHEWAATQIRWAASAADRLEALDDEVAAAKAALDAESDRFRAARKQEAYDRAVEARERWRDSLDSALLANAQLVRTHRPELTEAFPVDAH